MSKYYLTTTLPYVNAEPHLGFALEIIQADFLARYHTILGDEVVFNTGTDEHGLKIHRKAEEEGKKTQAYTDEYAAKFDDLKKALNLSYTHFTRTTNPHHKSAAQAFWKLCLENGDIYKKNYQIKYCVGCELEKTDSELEDNRCPIHPNLTLEIIDEENYFFKWSKYQQPLLDYYEEHPDFVLPDFRFKEIKNFIADGLNDFSISRLKEKMPWGVPVPNDPDQVMYVWFDALVNYISTIGWPEDQQNFESFWGTTEHPNAIQVAGKDNLRQQTAMWQAMLMSAKLPLSKQILIHGFILSDGQKMSKSLGNVVHPYDIVKKYGTDAIRFWVGHDANVFEDSDFTWEKFKESYNANLANGLGNLVARVAKLAENNKISAPLAENDFNPEVTNDIEKYHFNEAMVTIWEWIGEADKYVNENKPWELEGEKAEEVIGSLVVKIQKIGFNLQPFLPETAKKILDQFSGEIKAGEGLFPRISN